MLSLQLQCRINEDSSIFGALLDDGSVVCAPSHNDASSCEAVYMGGLGMFSGADIANNMNESDNMEIETLYIDDLMQMLDHEHAAHDVLSWAARDGREPNDEELSQAGTPVATHKDGMAGKHYNGGDDFLDKKVLDAFEFGVPVVQTPPRPERRALHSQSEDPPSLVSKEAVLAMQHAAPVCKRVLQLGVPVVPAPFAPPAPEPASDILAPEPEPEASIEAPEPEPEAAIEAPEPEPEASIEAPEPEPEASIEAPEPEREAEIKAPEP